MKSALSPSPWSDCLEATGKEHAARSCLLPPESVDISTCHFCLAFRTERYSTSCCRISLPCPSRGRWVCLQIIGWGGAGGAINDKGSVNDTMSSIKQGMFEPFMKSFYVRSTDPTHIKTLKVSATLCLGSDKREVYTLWVCYVWKILNGKHAFMF